MAGLGRVTVDNKVTYKSYSISIDERCCGMLFDYGVRTDPFNGDYAATRCLSNNQVVKLTSVEQAEEYGITTKLLNGVPHYHISQFFEYTGNGSYVYVMFANCSYNFNAIYDFQHKVNGDMFQLGVWTERKLWTTDDDGNCTFTSLIAELQQQAEELGGRVGVFNEAVMPLSIVLCANTATLLNETNFVSTIRYRDLPNGTGMNCPKVSVVLGQNGTDEVHTIQNANIGRCPVGFLGLAMACLYLASAEKSIGSVELFDLNKNDTINHAELGFGYITPDLMQNDYTPISTITRTRSDIISKLGYIIPTTYAGKEASVYFSNDQTLSNGDYKLISLNRIISKCRRIVRSVLMPHINSPMLTTISGTISNTYATVISNEIVERLDAKMISSDTGDPQILGREVIINTEENVVDNDGISLELSIVPANISDVIEVTETSGDEPTDEEQ